MCGIAGVWSTTNPVSEAELRRMGDQMESRGPDNQGTYIDAGVNFGTVHQRLSIIDLNERSNQPMHSAAGRFVIVFNGEIYNFRSLREQLASEGILFNTTSDTEVLLALYQAHGPDCLRLLNGMFAFAVYDTEKKELFIARDRLGIKPLYFYRSPTCFAFSSDLKAFRACRHINLALDQRSVADFLAFEYVPQPRSIFEHCHKLLPGHYMIVTSPADIKVRQYWEIPDNQDPIIGESGEIVDQFSELFRAAVQRRLISDVKVGVFLSGGLDSSSIVSQMEGKFAAFTIDFESASNTLDRERSIEIAEAFQLEHRVTLVGKESLEDFIRLIRDLDEPVSDQSIIGLHYNYAVAKENDTRVILSGDGADEILGGYSYFRQLLFVNSHRKSLTAVAPLMRLAQRCLSQFASTSKPGKFRDLYIKYFLKLIDIDNDSDRHLYTLSAKSDAAIKQFVPRLYHELEDPIHASAFAGCRSELGRLLFSESKTSLVNKMLSKVDKTSMAHSTEARVPFLDHELVEFASRLPDHFRENKRILRSAMTGVLPQNILDDRKRGFNLPVRSWVQDFILADFESYLDRRVLTENLPIENKELDVLVTAARKPNADMGKLVWSLFVLSNWLQGTA